MKTFSIGEIANKAGINASTIRYYERVGLLPKPMRVNSKRRYTQAIFDDLKVIHMAQSAGLTIREIKHFLHEMSVDATPAERWTFIAEKKLSEVEEQIERLERAKSILQQTTDCTCSDLKICANFLPLEST